MLAMSRVSFSWLPGARLLSTTAAAAAAAVAGTLEEQLQRSPWLQMLPVPGAGRGLFAATDIEQGTVVIEEAPMLAAPSPHALDTTCHACLRPLAPGSAASYATRCSVGGSAMPFCSDSCSASAKQSWAAAAVGCDFGPLQQACRESGSKFPLMLAQLACLRIQQRWQGQWQQQGQQQLGCAGGSTGSGGGGGSTEGVPLQGDPLTQLSRLCFANVGEPPPPWVELHSLLVQGLQPLCGSRSSGSGDGSSGSGGSSSSASGGGSSSSTSSSSSAAGQGLTQEQLGWEFSLQWFCDALARLHLNSFRVDTVPPLDMTADPTALLRAAAASLAGPGATQHATGSAAYLLSSMINHSCEPNLDIGFPANNALAAFTAARDIAANEQLTVSYVDTGLGLDQRRAALHFGYGFVCCCPRCVEEEGAAGGGAS